MPSTLERTKLEIYSWYGTPIQIAMTDEVAEAYNRMADVIAEAEIGDNITTMLFKEKQKGDMEAWNKVATIINLMIELCGGKLDYTANDVKSNHLVKVPK